MVCLRVLTLRPVSSLSTWHATGAWTSGLKAWLVGEWECSRKILRHLPSAAPREGTLHSSTSWLGTTVLFFS